MTRTRIDDRQRTGSYSRRAKEGKIEVVENFCPKCGSKKAIINCSTNSPVFNRIRCTKCKYIMEDVK